MQLNVLNRTLRRDTIEHNLLVGIQVYTIELLKWNLNLGRLPKVKRFSVFFLIKLLETYKLYGNLRYDGDYDNIKTGH